MKTTEKQKQYILDSRWHRLLRRIYHLSTISRLNGQSSDIRQVLFDLTIKLLTEVITDDTNSCLETIEIEIRNLENIHGGFNTTITSAKEHIEDWILTTTKNVDFLVVQQNLQEKIDGRIIMISEMLLLANEECVGLSDRENELISELSFLFELSNQISISNIKIMMT